MGKSKRIPDHQINLDARSASTPTVSACDCARAIDSCVSQAPSRSEMQGSGTHDSDSLTSQVVHVLLMLFSLARPLLVKIPRAYMCAAGFGLV